MPTRNANTPALQALTEPTSLISKAFARLTPPAGAFDPDGKWSCTYTDTSTFNMKMVQGGLTITHQPGGQLHIDHFRICPQGYRYRTTADLQCSDKPLRDPTQWRVESKVAKGTQDAAYLNTQMVKRASVANGQLTIETGDSRRAIAIDGPYTCKWCLLDAVGRMPGLGTEQITFTMLDEYDELCPAQVIALARTARAKTKRGAIDITCYQHTGEATVPGMFYVDSAGRVLFYVAGMQMLALAEVNGQKTGGVR